MDEKKGEPRKGVHPAWVLGCFWPLQDRLFLPAQLTTHAHTKAKTDSCGNKDLLNIYYVLGAVSSVSRV